MGRKILPCVFLLDVLCSFRESEKIGVMDRCFECSHYRRFMLEAEEEDVRVMEEIDREREELERENQGDVLGEIEREYVRKKWGSGGR
jgi:hypothetical protein